MILFFAAVNARGEDGQKIWKKTDGKRRSYAIINWYIVLKTFQFYVVGRGILMVK